jgi:hypothetical protein
MAGGEGVCQGLVMEELELAPLDVALAVGDEGEHRLLGDVRVVVNIGGFVVVLLELGALERRRVTHGAAADGSRGEGGIGVGMRVCQSGRVGSWALPGNATTSPRPVSVHTNTHPISVRLVLCKLLLRTYVLEIQKRI